MGQTQQQAKEAPKAPRVLKLKNCVATLHGSDTLKTTDGDEIPVFLYRTKVPSRTALFVNYDLIFAVAKSRIGEVTPNHGLRYELLRAPYGFRPADETFYPLADNPREYRRKQLKPGYAGPVVVRLDPDKEDWVEDDATGGIVEVAE